ncbi:MAG: hypothetical protein KF862_07520 [Chitinophagaceae bacterium]|nr:hypothetical protein [Chitinophagaceae bacterium]
MKKIILIAICFPAIMATAQSKKFQFKTGAEYGLPKKAEDLSFFGNNENGIVNLSLKKDELYFTRFNPKSLAQTGEKVIPIPDATRNMNSEIVIDFNPLYFWLRSDWDKDRQKEMLFVTTIDVNNGKLGNKNEKLIETDRLAGSMSTTGWYSFKKTDKYQFNFDANRTKLLVSYRLAPADKKDKKSLDRIGIYVFDRNMNKLWGNEFTMPYNEAVMDNADFSVDAEGNAYLLAKVYNSDSRKEFDKATGNPAYHLEVFKFTKNNEQVVHTTVSLDQYFIRESTLIENAQHDMVIACTYSKDPKTKTTEGIFLGLFNGNKVVDYKKGFYKFPISELVKFESRREKRKREKKDDYEIPNLKVTDVLVEKDGSVLIACEEQYTRTHQRSGFGANGMMTSSSTYVTYHYDDILATRVNASGEIEWLKKIPKMQYGTRGKGTMSFKLISDETGYYFLYLDNIKNQKMDDDDTPAKHIDGAGGQVFVSKIDNKGNVTKELIFNTREEDMMIYPSEFTKINDKQFIGRARLKKTLFQPLLITVN